MDISTKEHRALILGASGKHAGAFLLAVPKCNTTMLNEELVVSFLFRLHKDLPFISTTLRCDCSKQCLAGTKGEHLMCCAAGGEWTSRHNRLVRVTMALSASAGIKVVAEPVNCFPNDDTQMRPDVRLFQPNFSSNCRHDFITDVSVTHPGGKTNIEKHSSDTVKGASALQREKSKMRDYGELAKNNDLHFVPLVVESPGRIGPQFNQFIERNVKKAHNRSGGAIRLPVLRFYWVKRLSVQLQIENARLLLGRTARISAEEVLRHDEANHLENILDSEANMD